MSEEFPRRPKNPLGQFASVNYVATLYMLSPDAYNAFVASGKLDVTTIARTNATVPGAVIIAQTGGTPSDKNLRSAAFEFDYYIDEIKIESMISAAHTGTSSNVTDFKFTIIEPYGFSLMSNLKRALDILKSVSSVGGFKDVINPTKQIFIMELTFAGYDIDGHIISNSDLDIDNAFNNESGGLYKKYYELTITGIKYRIDGKVTTYSVDAKLASTSVSLGTKYGRLSNGVEIKALTVEEAIGGINENYKKSKDVFGILDRVNEEQTLQATNNYLAGDVKGVKPNQYCIKWVNADAIKNAYIVTDDDKDKKNQAMSDVIKTIESTETASTESNKVLKKITFKNDTAIVQAISNVIARSTFISGALKTLASNTEICSRYAYEDARLDGDKSILQWFNISSSVEILDFDKQINDYVYKITYIIQPYMIPAAIVPYGNDVSGYYGPHKMYDFWYTGKNSEILKFEQKLDNNYYVVMYEPIADPALDSNTVSPIPISMNKQVDANKQGTIGFSASIRNSIETNLKDPASMASATIQILGDPDFLMQDRPDTVRPLYNKYYNDKYTVNPTGGQIFIEIDYREAVDYNHENGLMKLNDSILFWDYSPAVRQMMNGRKGVSYLVTKVTSTFNKGNFIQDLSLVVNTFSNVKSAPAGTGSSSTANVVEVTQPIVNNRGDY